MVETPLHVNIVITGASSGIGREIALELAEQERQFFLTARDTTKLEQVNRAVEQKGASSFFAVGDVGSEEDVEELFNDAVQKLGGIDVCFLNAGVGRFGNIEDLSSDDFDIQFNTNVKGVFLWMRLLVPYMKKRGKGQIIVTSSNLGLDAFARTSLYAATKWAVQAIVKAVREEVKGTGVKISTINPGSVNTPWFDGKNVDRKKMLSPRDVAKAAKLILEQSETSDIEMIVLKPGKN